MLDFQLFRAKVFPSSQRNLFDSPEKRRQILRDAIQSFPQVEIRAGSIWHVGNVSEVDRDALYFRVGRTSKSTIEIYEHGAFRDEQFETAPYTHVLMDIPLAICAIAKKARLSPYARAIANKLAKLLNHSKTARENTAELELDPIFDPEDLISYLAQAVSVSKFWITFKRPNPFDVNKDFVRPMQELLHKTGGRQGKTQIQANDLIAESLEELARSAAATGDKAAATMSLEPGKRAVTKSLGRNPVMISHEDLSDEEQKRRLLRKMRKIYERVRTGAGGAR